MNKPLLLMQPTGPFRGFNALGKCPASKLTLGIDLLGKATDAFRRERNTGGK
jgi:hypothetical protein